MVGFALVIQNNIRYRYQVNDSLKNSRSHHLKAFHVSSKSQEVLIKINIHFFH